MPGKTTYLDTPVVPIAAFTGSMQATLDCEQHERLHTVPARSAVGKSAETLRLVHAAAAVGDGAYKNIEEACKATIHVVEKISPQKSSQKKYDEAFPVYQGLYASLKKSFTEISQL